MPNWLTIELGLTLLTLCSWPVFLWCFRNLPNERWQFAAILPSPDRQQIDHEWIGTNITFYGVISALAYAAATSAFVFLCGSVGQPLWPTLTFIGLLLAVCIPASKLIAMWVEGGNVNFTVGGATFAGALFLPIALLISARTATNGFNAIALVAAAGLAYVLGEAIGRFGCLSFGCCYGRRLSDVGPLQRALYGSTATTYRGQLKKISYASNMENTPVVPVQSIASVVLFVLFLLGLWLFWRQSFAACALLVIWGSQSWRVYSETLRADYRGGSKISAHQWMALATCVITTATILTATNGASAVPSSVAGWASLARTEVVVAIQVLTVGIVWFMGRSQVTGALVNLRLFRERQ